MNLAFESPPINVGLNSAESMPKQMVLGREKKPQGLGGKICKNSYSRAIPKMDLVDEIAFSCSIFPWASKWRTASNQYCFLMGKMRQARKEATFHRAHLPLAYRIYTLIFIYIFFGLKSASFPDFFPFGPWRFMEWPWLKALESWWIIH